MKIALYSDLHLETMRNFPALAAVPRPVNGADLIILAGDIHQGTQGLQALADLQEADHIYVAGNHEYYHHDIEILDDHLFELAAQKKLNYLQRTSAVIQGVRFLGCTLWTDFNIQPGWRFGAELVAKAFLPDYKLIRLRGKQFTPSMGIELHRQNIDWLESALAVPFDGKTVVVTHHAPHPQSIHPRFNLSPINAAFVSDLGHLMGKADVWVHGHMHDSFDYTVHQNGGQTRVLVNPRGYVRKKGKARKMERGQVQVTPQVFENPFFNPQLVFEV
ncbi:calcineurin-like phosphoesterase family protein [Limnobacter thiooxidans]|uniref:Metallophosphoesterase family protein n=1 Tax=Limnobacter thiooxidans TaxID=131080 RepID=A0AA86J5F3_9BURK|nr:metallophosphoesterase [Limnobacter sp.]MCZ8016269.1 metallophosphoesterase [Limnobacter sp.]RZS39900.1 calcineurin-like phosphoesterase family protein [Limnobacter thiooxidans]BET27669.1 metallophosphoesterase family protein [Limnobacter thiooxidans]